MFSASEACFWFTLNLLYNKRKPDVIVPFILDGVVHGVNVNIWCGFQNDI